MNAPFDLRAVAGLAWNEEGSCALSGILLERFHALDARLRAIAATEGAEPFRFPDVISIAAMKRADYLASFPQLAVFPVTLDAGEANLGNFVARNRTGVPEVHLGVVDPTRTMLSPAACYHVYAHLQDSRLERTHVATLRCNCFRNEVRVAPLERQRAFTMREIVCVGAEGEVRAFLQRLRARVHGYATRLGLEAGWEAATDPFFAPFAAAKRLAQQLDPLKRELRLAGGLAISSVNSHRSFFGEAFGIRLGATPAFSGCVAFGLERWLYALIARHGPDAAAWPEL